MLIIKSKAFPFESKRHLIINLNSLYIFLSKNLIGLAIRLSCEKRGIFKHFIIIKYEPKKIYKPDIFQIFFRKFIQLIHI